MKNLTPAKLLSAAAVTSAALMGACHDRDRDNSSLSRSDAEPVVRDGAVVTPQSGLTSSRDEVATSPATSRDRVAASRTTNSGVRIAGAESPDPPTPAEPVRDQFIFDGAGNTDARYARTDAPIARERATPGEGSPTDRYARDNGGASADRRQSTPWQDDRDLADSESAREMTMGPNPTRPIEVTGDAEYAHAPLTNEQGTGIHGDGNADRVASARPVVAPVAATSVESSSKATDASKAPNPPTAATPTRDSFQFESADAQRTASARPNAMPDTENDLWEPVDAQSTGTDQTRKSDLQRDLATDRDAHASRSRKPDSSKAPDAPTAATPRSEEFDFSDGAANSVAADPSRTTPGAPSRAEERARISELARDSDADRARTNRSTREDVAGDEPALYESGGQVYPVSPESRILAILHAKNVDEIALGRLALERSSSQQVQNYARELITEHELADQRVRELAAEKGYALAEPKLVNRMLAREQAERAAPSALDHLTGLEGQAFDDAFVDHMTRGHAELITLMRHARPSIQDDDVYALIEELIPTIEDHETAAYQLTARF